MQQQGAGRLAADEDLIARLDVLQARSQRAVRHLDAQELQVLLVVRAGDAVGAHHRLLIDAQTQHDEMPVLEAQRLIARRGEAEDGFIPVVHRQHPFRSDRSHAPYYPDIREVEHSRGPIYAHAETILTRL